MNKEKIISEFSLKNFGSKGWKRGKLFCPDCGRNDKFGILFLDNGAVARCFYCQIAYPLWKVLKGIDRADLCDTDYEFKGKLELAPLKSLEVEKEEKEVKLPVGFVRIHNDEYLYDRDFAPFQYQQYKVGISDLDPRTEDKLIFQIFQNNKLAGWIARSRKSKEWHHENLRRHKELGEQLVLRYRNSENDFSTMLGGLDEITDKTHTLILVEGLFDKVNLDRLMSLNDQEEIKCCFTFGSDLSIGQVDLIPKSVCDIILMYDAGTINNIREAGMRLLSLFKVKVAVIRQDDIDPGNISENGLSELIFNMQDFMYFYRQIFMPKIS